MTKEEMKRLWDAKWVVLAIVTLLPVSMLLDAIGWTFTKASTSIDKKLNNWIDNLRDMK